MKTTQAIVDFRKFNAKCSFYFRALHTQIFRPLCLKVHLRHRYGFDQRTIKAKHINKQALLKEFKLPHSAKDPLLIGMVTRLVEQKGADLILDSLEALFQQPIQMVILGSGDSPMNGGII